MAAWRHGDTATWCCNEILSKLLELEWLERVARESGYFGVHLNSNNESRMLQANQMDSMLAKTARDGCNRATRYSYRGLTASAIAAAGAGGSRNLAAWKFVARNASNSRVPACWLLLAVARLARIHMYRFTPLIGYNAARFCPIRAANAA
jgi:hypothetical protein